MFYRFRQNNSYGRFVFDKERGISTEVWVEADSTADAMARAEVIGLYFDGAGDCPCCGDRWYPPWSDDGEVSPPTEVSGWSDYANRRENPDQAAIGYVH